MKKIAYAALLALGTSTLLAGCGLLPAVELDDPLALNDVEFVSDTLSDVSSPVGSTRVAGSGKLAAGSQFADLPASTFILTPSDIDISVAIKSAKLSAGCAVATGIINVTITNFKVNISDRTDRFKDSNPGATTFTFDAATGVISGLTASALGFKLDEIAKVVDILTTAPTPNNVKVSANIVTDPPLKGCTISLKFGKTYGKVKF